MFNQNTNTWETSNVARDIVIAGNEGWSTQWDKSQATN